MSDTLPMFPLNSVLFPGMSVPLRVFEDRYRALVHHLLRVDDPTERVFGSVGIREGYEVGEHGAQWLFRIGCRVKMTEVEASRRRHLRARRGRPRPDRAGAPRHHRCLPGRAGDAAGGARRSRSPTRSPRRRARRTTPTARRCSRSTASRRAATCRTTRRTSPGRWPRWPPSASRSGRRCSRPRTPTDRLRMVTDVLRAELRTMRVFPSLPATEIARTRWSPN